jgi:hypothetical protein
MVVAYDFRCSGKRLELLHETVTELCMVVNRGIVKIEINIPVERYYAYVVQHGGNTYIALFLIAEFEGFSQFGGKPEYLPVVIHQRRAD